MEGDGDDFLFEFSKLKVEQQKSGVSDEHTCNDSSSTTGEAVPMDDDIAGLESWFPNFIDFTMYSAPTKKPVGLTGNRRQPVKSVNEDPCFKVPPHPVTIRSKRRARTGVSVWPNGSPSLTDSSSTSTTSSSSSSALLSPLWLSGAEFLDEPMVESQKKKKLSSLEVLGKRCSHCGAQKTPQWRVGPSGPKTLCNACGVRYKAGRLLPEYRPACSPTFSSELYLALGI